LYFYQGYDLQQYMKKYSLRLGFMIQFKEKTPNNIFLIPSLAFTPFVTNLNVLSISLNLNNKNPISCNFYYKFALMIKIMML